MEKANRRGENENGICEWMGGDDMNPGAWEVGVNRYRISSIEMDEIERRVHSEHELLSSPSYMT